MRSTLPPAGLSAHPWSHPGNVPRRGGGACMSTARLVHAPRRFVPLDTAAPPRHRPPPFTATPPLSPPLPGCIMYPRTVASNGSNEKSPRLVQDHIRGSLTTRGISRRDESSRGERPARRRPAPSPPSPSSTKRNGVCRRQCVCVWMTVSLYVPRVTQFAGMFSFSL